ncbi:MAG: response regulator [Lentimicrobium sp.]|nr:response regulator [Lentimicrobium sp.]
MAQQLHEAFFKMALSIESSAEPEKNIFNFLQAIVEQTHSRFACFYLYKSFFNRDSNHLNACVLYSIYPDSLFSTGLEIKSSFLTNDIHKRPFLIYHNDAQEINMLPDFFPEEKNLHYIIPVEGIGFIQLAVIQSKKGLFSKNESIFGATDTENLKLLIEKFKTSLLNSFHTSTKTETNTVEPELLSFTQNFQNNPFDFRKRILATINHEIRSPFSLILGYSDLLKKTTLDATQRNYLEIIHKSENSLFDVIRKVLQFSNIYFNQLNIDNQPFDIIELLKNIEDKFQVLATNKELVLKFNVNLPSVSIILGDKDKLNHIINYLISNAIIFTEKGFVTFSAEIEDTTDEQIKINFCISDTGKGIDNSNFEKVLQYFGQEDEKINRNTGGLGLGLSISKHFISLLGGKLEMESKPGAGTTFRFNLTFEKGEQKYPPYLISASVLTAEFTEKIKVLIVDDDPYQLEIGKVSLKGWNITVAENGKKAVELLQNGHEFDIILMDIRMPVMDGISATKIIRDQLNIHTPIIALSGEAIKESIEESLQAGMNAFISKPYEQDKLLFTIFSNLNIPQVSENLTSIYKNNGLSGMSALFISEDKLQHIIAELLSNANIKSVFTCNLDEANYLIDNNSYDFILADVDKFGADLGAVFGNDFQRTNTIIAYTVDSNTLNCSCLFAGILNKDITSPEVFQSTIRDIVNFRPMIQNQKANATSDRLYDLSGLIQFIGTDESALKDLINAFLKYMPDYLQQLSTAVRNKEYEKISRIAHSIKSTVKQYKIKQVINSVELLEHNSKNGIAHDEIEELVKATIHTIELTIEQLKNDYFN